jgi:hypothetical protein
MSSKTFEAHNVEWRRLFGDVLREPVVALPGYARPLLRVADFQALVAEHTYNGRDRVRSTRHSPTSVLDVGCCSG